MGMESFELGLVSAEEGREVLETTRFCRQARVAEPQKDKRGQLPP